MATFRDRINAHLPIVLQFLSTASLDVIAVSAICGTQSLKKLSEFHELKGAGQLHQGHLMKHQ